MTIDRVSRGMKSVVFSILKKKKKRNIVPSRKSSFLFYFQDCITVKSVVESRLTSYLLSRGNEYRHAIATIEPDIPGQQIDNRTTSDRRNKTSDRAAIYEHTGPHKFIYPEVIDNVR